MNYELALQGFQPTSNRFLTGPSHLTLAEFLQLHVTEQELKNRYKIQWLQRAMVAELSAQDLQAGLDALVPVHHFQDGVYVRELTMPAGHLIVGRRHNQEHLVRMISGRCLCFTEHGMEEMMAPYTFLSPAGEKRVLLILEQTTWQTYHHTQLTDPDQVVAALTFPESDELLLNNKLQIGAKL
jgi:hypothetical protein